jgi:hypothetical protein
VLTPAEQQQLEAVIRPQIEQGRGSRRSARAFLNARRPH